MTRRRKTLLVVLAFLLVAGGFAWYWQATAVDRQVNALLAEVRRQERGLAERWLIKLGLMKDRRTDREWYEVADDLVKLGPSAMPELDRAWRDSEGNAGWVAASALAKLGDVRFIMVPIWSLKDKDVGGRLFAAEALGRLEDPRGVEPLIAALKDENARVRFATAWALGRVGDARAIEPLEELLDDENADVRRAAAEALKQLRRHSEGKP